MNSGVEVQRACAAPGIPAAAKLVEWAEAALDGRSEGAHMTVRVVDETEGAALNARYRGRTGATNVLAFGFDAPEAPSVRILGDIVVCAPVAAREAHEHAKRPDAHWAHLVVHGTLHLLGYDHDELDAAGEMEALEREILARLGYPDPYADEVGS
ncbi:MAG: rRNA maturation RNase YbeY [Thiotrichales bacterium]|nr:rRNA maturation RNase YbeY [Thiotrichales bacterium]MCY4285341.1 rRNA maturation RNase YbeY [Thiotrichales bacterium]MCY4348987.1 rRNA maturation RNase YbeY [Thiotrichales bacterium]